MEIVLSAAIGVLAASGVWLILRPRTFQVIVGLCLLSYAVNLFIFSMGRVMLGVPPIPPRGGFVDPAAYADPLPQAIVLTAIVIRFSTTALFLVGVSLVNGVTGTLNMAHLVQLVPALTDDQHPLFHAGAGIMAVAFLIKAGIWPLAFWLRSAYAAGAAPVAALFAVMTKGGVYVLIRLSFLIFGAQAGPVSLAGWVFVALVLLSGFATLIATLRIGIRTFWGGEGSDPPRILALEFAPILVLGGFCWCWRSRRM